MAGMTVTKSVTDLQSLFNSMSNVYYRSTEIKSTDLAAESLTVDFELPVLSDGANFDTGEPDVTEIKLTTQRIWSRVVKKGDSDISFQVASIDGAINDLFLKKVGNAVSKAAAIVDGKTYKGQGYSLDPQTITGALICVSEDKASTIILPLAQIVSSLKVADGDNPAYFQCKVTTKSNSEGIDIFVLNEAGE